MLNKVLHCWTLVLLAFSSFAFARTKTYKIPAAYINKAIEDAAHSEGIPARLLYSVCKVESALKPDAFVFGDGGGKNHAFGMCQVLRTTAAEYGQADPGCKRDFRNRSLPRVYNQCKLFGPRVNARIAAKYLKKQLKRYNGNLVHATAAYNTGSLRYCGKRGVVTNKKGQKLYSCIPGDILNRTYVNRVKVMLAGSPPSSRPQDDELLRRNFFSVLAANDPE